MDNHQNTSASYVSGDEKSLISQIIFPHPHIPQVKADILGYFSEWPISNTTTFLWFIVVLFFIFYYSIRKFQEIPSYFQSLVELFMESIESLINSLTGGKAHRTSELLFPIAAIFLIIGSVNIIGSFPIITQFTWNEGGTLIPLFRKATSDINVTFPLALTIVLSMQIFGIRNWGFFGYTKRFFPLDTFWKNSKQGIGGFFLGLIELFVGLLELVSEFVKIISLSLRLFGNMFAGEILLAILTGIFAILLPAVWLGFDFLVAVIQTVVIGCLTAVYYTLVVREKDQKGH